MTYARRLMFTVAVPAMGALALLAAEPVQAATASSTILVTATVLSFCTILTGPLAFGNYSSAVLAATSTITVACTSGTTYNVGLDIGQGTGATVAARKMSFLSNTLSYGLFSDAGHATVWGPTIATNTVTGVATGLPQALTVYGQVPAAQLVAPGAYTDTVTATITY
jgi:spore coat protein U-like protein